MKLEKPYLEKACRDAMIMQYISMLRAKGYSVEQEKRLGADSSSFCADLYAEKNGEKRLYEFKVIGKKQAATDSIHHFRKHAQEIGAIPIVVYVNPPEAKNIEIDDLSDKIFSYISREDTPPDLEMLSRQPMVDDVEVDEISDIKISSEHITATGDAIIYVKLNHDDDVKATEDFPMTFTAVLDHNLSIEKLQYSIDTSSWYALEPEEASV